MTKTKQLIISLIYFIIFSWVVVVWGVISPDPYSYHSITNSTKKISYFVHQSKNKKINEQIASVLNEIVEMADQGKDFQGYLNKQKVFDNIIIKRIILVDLLNQINKKDKEIDNLRNKHNELLMKIDNYTIRNNHKKQVKERDYTLFDELYYGIFGKNFDLEKFKFHFQEKYNIISFILVWLFFLTKISKTFNKLFDNVILILLWIINYVFMGISLFFKLITTTIYCIQLIFNSIGWGIKDIKNVVGRVYTRATAILDKQERRYFKEKRDKERGINR